MNPAENTKLTEIFRTIRRRAAKAEGLKPRPRDDDVAAFEDIVTEDMGAPDDNEDPFNPKSDKDREALERQRLKKQLGPFWVDVPEVGEEDR